MNIGIKLLTKTAKTPTRATSGSSGYDVYADLKHPVNVGPMGFNKVQVIPTGVALDIPEGWEAQFRSRSGLAFNYHITGPFGTIDSDYVGEIKYLLWSIGDSTVMISPGDKVGQLVFQKVPEINLVEVDEIKPKGDRVGGFGSTGR